MTARALLPQPAHAPLAPVHLTMTAAQAAGLVALATEGAERVESLATGRSDRAAATRGLHRLRAAVQGLRPGDADRDLERLGEVLADVVSPEAVGLLTARIRDVLDVALLWSALERAHRLAIRDDLPHVGQTGRLLHAELLTTLVWRLDAVGLLTSIGMAPDLGGERRS